VGWVLDADIRGFFDAIDHVWLRRFLEHRIADRRMLRLIQKWLSAGVLYDGALTQSTEGTPQGATISPLLANVFLHYVFDLWALQWRRRNATGDMIVVRYADDFVAGFQRQSDAMRFLADLRERFVKFGLELHPDKTRVLRFGKFAIAQCRERGQRKPETFDFLGFTHACGKARSGSFVLLRRTTAKRMRAKLREVAFDLKQRRHDPLPKQGAWLQRVVRGYFAYHAVPTNVRRLDSFRAQVVRIWHRALRRRSQHDGTNWSRMGPLADRWVPHARVVHPLPEERFDARTRGKSPVR
jgi:group II intron reverse transcriptase/maturase